MRSFDWARTAVGPVEQWPQSLRTALSILLGSGYPMYIGWGTEFVQFYNDAYRPILGSTKHPAALGQRTAECFAEIWDFIGPMFRRVMDTREATTLVDQMLPLDRHGYAEECYFTFSYSAIREESGRCGGVFVTCIETTERVIAERRLKTLRDLAARGAEAKTVEEACHVASTTLAANPHDVPFALLYLLEPGEQQAALVGCAGLEPGSAAAPRILAMEDGIQPWPLVAVAHSRKPEVVRDVRDRFGSLPGGAWPEAPRAAVVLPIAKPGQERPTGFLVAGGSARRALDEPALAFVEMVAANIATAIANVRACEEERGRAEALAELDRAKTAFFSNVSHEFRTPLGLLLGPLEDALNGPEPLPAALHESLEVAYRNALRLLKLVNTLLDFARIEAGRIEAAFEPVDLAALSAELASVFRSAIERAGLELAVDCPLLGEPVYVDRGSWEKIVLNLLSNALKFTFEGSIRVSLRRAGGMAELSVADTGVGIPESELPRLFDRFYRVPGTRSRTHEGTGIGLALVSELAALHGGRVRVESAPGRGATFTVSVPLGTGHLPPAKIGARSARAATEIRAEAFVEEALRWLPEPAHTTAWGSRGRVLVADDNSDMREYLCRLLSRDYEVEAVADGREALRRATEQPPDLVLTDVMMPGLNGFELLQRLRAQPATCTVPIILLSARAGEESRVEGLESGADDYLIKPFTAREVLARVGTHLNLGRLRREMTESLAESQHRLRALYSQVAAGIAQTDLSGRFVQVNRKICEILGRSMEDVLQLSIHDAVHPQDAEHSRAAFARMGEGDEVLLELRYVRPDAAVVWVNASLSRVCGTDGDPLFAVVVVQDITDRKRLEQKLNHAARLESLGVLAGGIAHDFNNLLTGILGGASLLVDEFPAGSADRMVADSIVRASERAAALTRSMLAYAGEGRLLVEPLDLSSQVREIAVLISAAIPKHVHLELDLAPDLPAIEADAGQLQQLIMNLVINGAEASGPGSGRVTVTTSVFVADADWLHATVPGDDLPPGQYVRLAVRDTGVGMDAATLARIFEPFFTTKFTGRGLGLAAASGIVRSHKGALRVASAPGQGSTFEVLFPPA